MMSSSTSLNEDEIKRGLLKIYSVLRNCNLTIPKPHGPCNEGSLVLWKILARNVTLCYDEHATRESEEAVLWAARET